jgi:VanZ family protein
MTVALLVSRLRFVTLVTSAIGVVLALGPFSSPDGIDKVVHVGCFYGYSLLVLASYPQRRKSDLTIGLIALGAASEIAQGFVGRDCSFSDFVADGVGVCCAAAPVWIARFRRLAQSRPDATLAELQASARRNRIIAAELKRSGEIDQRRFQMSQKG